MNPKGAALIGVSLVDLIREEKFSGKAGRCRPWELQILLVAFSIGTD